MRRFRKNSSKNGLLGRMNWSLAEFSVPRFYRLFMASPISMQLHLFGDASERAFCAVAYFRFEYPGGERDSVHL